MSLCSAVVAAEFDGRVFLTGPVTVTMKVQLRLCAVLFFLLALRASAITTKIIDAGPEEIEKSPDYCATCVQVDSLCYNRTYLFELDAPFRSQVVIKKMGILAVNNVLYYSFEPQLDDPEYFKVAYVSLDNPNVTHVINNGNIARTFNFSVFDINQNERKIYLGGDDGIWYIERPDTDQPVLRYFVEQGSKITNVVSKDYVYFTKEQFDGIVKDKDGKYDFPLTNTTVKNFILDKDVEYTVVYLDKYNTGLYAFNSKSKEHVRLSKNGLFRGLTVDLDGTVYAWYIDGIYKVTLDPVLVHSTVRQVSNILVGAMTFDNSNNIIYSHDKSLFRLTKTNTNKCPVWSKGKNCK